MNSLYFQSLAYRYLNPLKQFISAHHHQLQLFHKECSMWPHRSLSYCSFMIAKPTLDSLDYATMVKSAFVPSLSLPTPWEINACYKPIIVVPYNNQQSAHCSNALDCGLCLSHQCYRLRLSYSCVVCLEHI